VESGPLALRSRLVNSRLVVTLAIRGDLSPRLSRGGRDVQFVNAAGAAVVNYSNLLVFDADGVALPARFEVVAGGLRSTSSSAAPKAPRRAAAAVGGSDVKGLRLTVDDSGARYPLTIDPIAQQAYLKASNTDAYDYFGSSVAVSGDTVVVGALYENSNTTGVNGDQGNNSAPESGAVYVFVVDLLCHPPDCNGNGVCEAGTCVCDTGYAGAGCDRCAPDYYDYPNCFFCVAATTCSGHGTCNGQGDCDCDTGYAGGACDQCAPDLYDYPNCVFCQAAVTCLGHGTCNAYGECDCDPGYVGENCTLPPGAIPTTTEWGLVVLTLLLLTAGKVTFGRAFQQPRAA